MEMFRQRICTKTETTMRLIYESDIDNHTNKQNTKNELARRIINIIKNISSREDNNGWKRAYLAMKLRMQIKEIIYWTRNRYSLKERIWNNIINKRSQEYHEPRKKKKFPFSLLNLLLSINATIPHHAATTSHHALTIPHHAATTPRHAAATPNHAATTPHHVTTIPHHVVTTPHYTAITPHHATTTPHHTEITPHHAKTTPHHATTILHHAVTTPPTNHK